MPIGTPVQIGAEANTPGSATTVVTTGAVPAGALVIVVTGYGDSDAARILTSVSGGGLTWAIDLHQVFDGAIFWGLDVVSAQAPSGLASGTTITLNWNVQVLGDLTTVVYCEGLETTSPGVKDVSDGNGVNASGNWDTTATSTTVADTLVIGGCINDGLATNTATGGASELSDFQYATENFSACCEYKIISGGAASASLTGTWTGGASDKTAGFVAYKGLADTGQVLQASADSADGNWTNEAGGTTLAASIDEDTASDSDYIRSELGPQSSGCRVKLEAGGDPAVSTGHEINWRIAKDTASGQTINMTVKLYQGGGNSLGGGTLIADFDRNNVTNTFTDFTETLSGGEADAITDYTDLYLEFWADVP